MPALPAAKAKVKVKAEKAKKPPKPSVAASDWARWLHGTVAQLPGGMQRLLGEDMRGRRYWALGRGAGAFRCVWVRMGAHMGLACLHGCAWMLTWELSDTLACLHAITIAPFSVTHAPAAFVQQFPLHCINRRSNRQSPPKHTHMHAPTHTNAHQRYASHRIYVEESEGSLWGWYEGAAIQPLVAWLQKGRTAREESLLAALQSAPLPPDPSHPGVPPLPIHT
jgi:hypothetical protein